MTVCRFARSVFGALLVLAVAFYAPAVSAQASFQLRDGVIVDPGKSVLYVMSTDGGIRALDLRGGRDIWTSDVAARPLALVNDRLVAQVEPKDASNLLRLVYVNTASPNQILSTRTATLPLGVVVGIDQTPYKMFFASARARGDAAEIVWQYSSRTPQGVAPARRTGVVADPPAAAAAAAAGGGGRGGGGGGGRAAGAAPVSSARSGALLLNVRSGTLTISNGALGGADTLRRAAPTMAAPPPGAALSERQAAYFSADGKHILETARVGDDRVWEQYRWTIREADTRRVVGQIASHMSVAPFFVKDGLIVFATDPYTRREEGHQPLKLRAFDLATGREQWSTEMRDTKSRGSLPP